MTRTLRMLDSLGSFCDAGRTVEAICWTHRGDGWAVHDWQGSRVYAVRTRREAIAKVRAILRERAAGLYDTSEPTAEEWDLIRGDTGDDTDRI